MSAMYGNGNQLVNTWMPLILFFDMFACLFVRNFLPAAHLRRKIGARETLARRPAPVTTRERPTEPPRAPGPSAF